MHSLSHLEVIIKKNDDRFKAECNEFPGCSGSGETVDAALSKLSASIGRSISRAAKQTFNKVLTSTEYTEIILDDSKATKEERRVFPVADLSISTPKKPVNLKEPVIFRIKPNANINKKILSYVLKQKNQEETTPDINELNEFFGRKQESLNSHMLVAIIGSATNGVDFAFPINFN